MSRKRTVRKELLPWLSANPDGHEGRFVQIGNSLVLSNSFHKLTPSAQFMYLCMCMESAGKRDFKFPESAMKKYGIIPRTGRRCLEALIEHGFVECSCSGKNTRTASDYRFSFKWKGL